MSETSTQFEDAGAKTTPASTTQPIREADVVISEAKFDEIGIADLVALWREAGLREFEALACREDGAIVQVELERRLDPDRLGRLEAVDEFEHVSASDTAHLYVIEFTAPKFPSALVDGGEDLFGTCDPDVTEYGVALSLVGTQQAISAAIREYETAGLSPDLRRLGSYEGPRRPLDDLTERQREVLRTAFDLGYYEVPRQATSDDVAAELGVDPSTVTEHLQRAERNLLRWHLSPGG